MTNVTPITEKPKQVLLTAQQIVEAQDVQFELVEVPEWGGIVRIRSLTAENMTEFLRATEMADKGDSTVKAMMLTACDEEGNLIFKDPSALQVLKKKSLLPFVRIQERVLVMNGLTEESRSARKNA
jgi:hypothetical protein